MEKVVTVYDVLVGARRGLRAEPKSYKQSTWMTRRGMTANELMLSPEPPCGTAFCRAGHIVMAHDGWNFIRNGLYRTGDATGIEQRANDILNPVKLILSADDRLRYERDIRQLFDAADVDHRAGRSLDPGSDRYVRMGSKGFTEFMNTWEHALRATEAPLAIRELAESLQG